MCSRKLEIKRASNILHIRVQLIDQIEHRMERPVHSGVFCIGTVSGKLLQHQLVFCDALHWFDQIGGQRHQMSFKNVIKMRSEIKIETKFYQLFVGNRRRIWLCRQRVRCETVHSMVCSDSMAVQINGFIEFKISL